jgi:hypothetical protein
VNVARLFSAAVAGAQGKLGRAATTLDTAHMGAQRVRIPQVALEVEIMRARQIAELTGDVARARSILQGAVDSIDVDTVPPLNLPLLEIANAFAVLGDTVETRTWLARQDYARPPEAIRKERDYELARLRLLTRTGRASEAVEPLQRLGVEYFCQRCVAMALAEAFDAANQPDSAAARYRMYIDAPSAFRIFTDQYYLARAHFRLAELLELKGDRAGAQQHYAAFVDLWKDADPELQPRVRAAQQRLQALRGPG